jgi:hypothetical protein
VKRYIVLTSSNLLYYKQQSDRKPASSIAIGKDTMVQIETAHLPNHIEIQQARGCKYILKAESDNELSL